MKSGLRARMPSKKSSSKSSWLCCSAERIGALAMEVDRGLCRLKAFPDWTSVTPLRFAAVAWFHRFASIGSITDRRTARNRWNEKKEMSASARVPEADAARFRLGADSDYSPRRDRRVRLPLLRPRHRHRRGHRRRDLRRRSLHRRSLRRRSPRRRSLRRRSRPRRSLRRRGRRRRDRRRRDRPRSLAGSPSSPPLRGPLLRIILVVFVVSLFVIVFAGLFFGLVGLSSRRERGQIVPGKFPPRVLIDSAAVCNDSGVSQRTFRVPLCWRKKRHEYLPRAQHGVPPGRN